MPAGTEAQGQGGSCRDLPSQAATGGDPEMAAARGGPSGLRRTVASPGRPARPLGVPQLHRDPRQPPFWHGPGPQHGREADPGGRPRPSAGGAPHGAAEAALLGLRRARPGLPAGGGRWPGQRAAGTGRTGRLKLRPWGCAGRGWTWCSRTWGRG